MTQKLKKNRSLETIILMAAELNWKSFGNVYNDIVVDQRSTDWFLLGYEEGSQNKIKLISRGAGSLKQMALSLNDDMVGYGYLKVYDETLEYPQQKPEFVHITFIGKRVKPQERARSFVHRLDVQQAFPNFIIEFEANGLEELDINRLHKEINDMKARLSG